MIRALATLAIAAAAGGCVGPRVIGAAPSTPAWLGERISTAEATRRSYPLLSETPEVPEDARTPQDWAAEVAEIQALRAEVLADPALDDPDAAAGDKLDAETFIANTRTSTEREIDSQTPD